MQVRFELVLVAIVKDEAPYLAEWIAFHHLQGVEHFFIFDNGSTDGSRETVQPYVVNGLVTWIDWPLVPGQEDAYGYACSMFGPAVEWMAFIDVDEFLVTDDDQTVAEFLRSRDFEWHQLLIPWKFMGHAGHRTRPEGLVIQNFAKCEDGYSGIVKAIVRPNYVWAVHAHNADTTSGLTKNARGDLLREDWRIPREAIDSELLCIHFFTKSYEEYVAKIAKGQVDGRHEKVVDAYEDWDFSKDETRLLPWVRAVHEEIERLSRLPMQPFRYGSESGLGSNASQRGVVLLSQRLAEEALSTFGEDAEILRYWFGTVVRAPSLAPSKARQCFEELASALAKELRPLDVLDALEPEWAIGNVDLVTRTNDGIEFSTRSMDPQIAMNSGSLGCRTQAILLSIVYCRQPPGEMESFLFSGDAESPEIQRRRFTELTDPGAYLVIANMTQEPVRVQAARLDPGGSGTYGVVGCRVYLSV